LNAPRRIRGIPRVGGSITKLVNEWILRVASGGNRYRTDDDVFVETVLVGVLDERGLRGKGLRGKGQSMPIDIFFK
jgi:hypothetical protein